MGTGGGGCLLSPPVSSVSFEWYQPIALLYLLVLLKLLEGQEHRGLRSPALASSCHAIILGLCSTECYCAVYCYCYADIYARDTPAAFASSDMVMERDMVSFTNHFA